MTAQKQKESAARTEPWVCPWGICNHDQAQECRAEMRVRKGCGGMFPEGTTLEQAKKLIGPLEPK